MLLAFVETPQCHRRLTVFPIVAADEPQLSYVLMLDALRRGVLSIEEDQNDHPPHLIARNRARDPVLILDCETLGGLGENQSTHQSVLLGPDSVTRLPISCRFTGKWSCEEQEKKLTKSLDRFPLLEGQVGILAFLGQHLLGLDALGSPQLYAPLHRRLLTGYLVTALAAGRKGKSESRANDAEVRALARALENAERIAAPCHGHGEYSTLHGEVTGGELRHNGHLVHLSVFPNGVAA
jgi:hypothetical protein